MKALEFLKDSISQSMQLTELIEVFEKMCQIAIDGVNEDDEMLLFETGTFSFSGPEMFHFSLVRQFPNEDEEYFQLHLEILYEPSDINKSFSEPIWNDDVEGDFFEFIRSSDAYLSLKDEKVHKINIFMDET